jgi:hypothetical protein
LVNYLTNDDLNGGNAAFNEHTRRQAVGYTFAQESNSEITSKGLAACGTVEVIGDDDNSNGPGNFLISMSFGLLLIVLIRKIGLQKLV